MREGGAGRGTMEEGRGTVEDREPIKPSEEAGKANAFFPTDKGGRERTMPDKIDILSGMTRVL